MSYYEPEYTETPDYSYSDYSSTDTSTYATTETVDYFDQGSADAYYDAYSATTDTGNALYDLSTEAWLNGDLYESACYSQAAYSAYGVADENWDAWNAEYQQPVDYGTTDTSSWSAADTSGWSAADTSSYSAADTSSWSAADTSGWSAADTSGWSASE